MRLKISGPLATLIESSEAELTIVKQALTFPISSMRLKYQPHKGRYVSWEEEGKSFLFDEKYFPSKFLRFLPSTLNLEVEEATREIHPTFNPADLPFSLKDFQLQAIEKILSVPSALVVGPTSIGKTFLIATLVSCFQKYRIVILCHNKGLAKQNLERLQDWFPSFRIGQIFAGKKEIDAQISVATFQSLRGLPFKADIVLIDECVHVLAPSYLQTFIHTEAVRWYGFTATPRGRSDRLDAKLQALFDEKIAVGNFDVGLQEELLCPVDFYVIKYTSAYNIPAWRNQDSNWIYQNFVALDAPRNKLIQFLANFELERTGKVVLVLVHRLNHLDALKKLLPQSAVVSYKSKLKEREKVRSLTSGIILSTRVIEEGIDNHSIYSIINAACVRSQIAIIQRIGRGLRFEHGKRLAFFDIWDWSTPVLKSQGQTRVNLYKRFGDVQIFDAT